MVQPDPKYFPTRPRCGQKTWGELWPVSYNNLHLFCHYFFLINGVHLSYVQSPVHCGTRVWVLHSDFNGEVIGIANAGVNNKSCSIRKTFVQRCNDGQQFILFKNIFRHDTSFLPTIRTLGPGRCATVSSIVEAMPKRGCNGGPAIWLSVRIQKLLWIFRDTMRIKHSIMRQCTTQNTDIRPYVPSVVLLNYISIFYVLQISWLGVLFHAVAYMLCLFWMCSEPCRIDVELVHM